jgi:hypothetical protein
MTDLYAIAEAAKALRAAGVRKLVVDGLTLELADADTEAVIEAKPAYSTLRDLPDETDPLNDPATYGGGKVPGFNRTRPQDDE